MRKWASAICIGVLSLVVGSPAFAQLSAQGGPVDISADSLEVINSQDLATYIGQVDVIQGDARLQADRIEVQFVKGSVSGNNDPLNTPNREIETITAIGNVFYTTPGEVARGDRGVYQLSSETITITGDVVVTQDGNVIRSEKLVMNIQTGEASFEAKTKGRRSKTRVRSVFFPQTQEAETQEDS